MILNSDFNLYHPLWEKADELLCNNERVGLFNRLVDVFLIACSIGIKEDSRIDEAEFPLENPKTIGRNTYQSMQNTDLRDLLDLMLQNILINSKTIDLDVDERLKLAFNPDYTLPKITATGLLIGFANYGIVKIFEHIDTEVPLLVIAELYDYFDSLTESDYTEILNSITLDQLLEYT